MSNQTAPRVRFNLKSHTSKDKEVLVYAIVRYSYKNQKIRLVYSSGEKIKPEYWDKVAMRAKKTIVRFKALNKRLQYVEDSIIDVWEEKGEQPKDKFKLCIDRVLGRKINGEVLNEGVPDYVTFAKKLYDTFDADPSFNRNTLKTYKTAYNIIVKYGEIKGEPIEYETFTWPFRSTFKNWLYSYKKYSKNSASKYWKIITFFLKEANKQYGHGNTIYRENDWNLPTVKTRTKVAFSFSEIRKIKEHDFSYSDRLQKTADLFVAMSHFGQRISDWDQIKMDSFTDEDGFRLLKIIMTKTGGEAIIPLFPEAEEILVKYNYQLPQYTGQAFNRNIKDVVEEVLPDKKFTRKISKAGKELTETVPAYEFTSSHSCRKSFAKNYYTLPNVKISDLMVCTGHKTEAQFLEYAEVNKEDAAKRLSRTVGANWSKMEIVKAG